MTKRLRFTSEAKVFDGGRTCNIQGNFEILDLYFVFGNVMKTKFQNLKDELHFAKAFSILYSSTSPTGGNQVEHNTETVAKSGRLGSAQNDKLMQHFIELTMFCSMKHVKTQRKLCQAYVGDQYRCNKIWENKYRRQIDGVSNF